MNKGTL